MAAYLIPLLAALALAIFIYTLFKKLRKSLLQKLTRNSEQIKSLKAQLQKVTDRQKNAADQLSLINKAVHAAQPHPKMRMFTILSMPKCGGSSIYATLLHSFPEAEIIHLHFYSSQGLQRYTEFAGNPEYPLGPDRLRLTVERATSARTLMNHLDPRNLLFLSGVREPVSLAISTFFQAFYLPDHPQPNYTVDEIREKIETSNDSWFSWAELDQWFDSELKLASGHDVFDRPFPKEKGYEVFSKGGNSLLLYRLENMDTILDAISELTWVPPSVLNLQKTNIGEKKSYGTAYHHVVSNLKFSASFLDRVYSSRYATHFYSASELASFKSRWSMP